MSASTILPTQNEEFGAWGTAAGCGLGVDPAVVWQAASAALLEGVEGITPQQVRFVLDARWGRHMVDALSFLSEGRRNDPAAIRRKVLDYIATVGMSSLFETLREFDGPVVKALRRRVVVDAALEPVDPALLAVAQRHLGVETLRVRGGDRWDFHEVSVGGMAAALQAAFDAGRASVGRRADGATASQRVVRAKGRRG